MLCLMTLTSFANGSTCKLAVVNFKDDRNFYDRDKSYKNALIITNTVPYGINAYNARSLEDISENEFVLSGNIDYLDSSFGHLNPGTFTNVLISRKSQGKLMVISKGIAINFSRFLFDGANILKCDQGQVQIGSP